MVNHIHLILYPHCRKPSIKIRIVTLVLTVVFDNSTPIAENHLLK